MSVIWAVVLEPLVNGGFIVGRNLGSYEDVCSQGLDDCGGSSEDGCSWEETNVIITHTCFEKKETSFASRFLEPYKTTRKDHSNSGRTHSPL